MCLFLDTCHHLNQVPAYFIKIEKKIIENTINKDKS